jgi:hypothetical protein
MHGVGHLDELRTALGGIYKQPVNTDMVFRQFEERLGKVVIINDLPNSTLAERRANTQLVQAIYNSDFLEDIPSCRCGAESTVEKEGNTCLKCGTTVTRVVDDDTGIVCWLRAPKHVDALMNPTMLVTLWQFFYKGSMTESKAVKQPFDFLRYAMDPLYVVPTRTARPTDVVRVLAKYREHGFKRGYNEFIRDYDRFIDVFVNDELFRYADDSDQVLWIKFLNIYRDLIFVQHVPSPPPSLLVLEVTDTLTYRSDRTTEAVNAVRQLLSIDTKDNRPSRNERLTMLAMFGLAKFAVDYAVESERGKTGMWRMHVYAMRLQLSSFRCVAYSLHEEHRPDDVVLPWGVMVKCMYFHLANLLDKRGYTYPQIVDKLARAVEFYDREIDDCLDILMMQFSNHGEFPGPMVVMVRFPTLGPASISPFFIRRYTLPDEGCALGFPNTNTTGMNADFDGDKFTGWFPLDLTNTRRWHDIFGCHNNVMDPNNYRKASGDFPLPRPLTINMHGWLQDGNRTDPGKVEYMQMLVG